MQRAAEAGIITTRNEQIPTKSTRTQMDDQRKDHIDLKRPKHKKQSKQLQTYNLPINDVENFTTR